MCARLDHERQIATFDRIRFLFRVCGCFALFSNQWSRHSFAERLDNAHCRYRPRIIYGHRFLLYEEVFEEREKSVLWLDSVVMVEPSCNLCKLWDRDRAKCVRSDSFY